MKQLTLFDQQEEYQPRFQAFLEYKGKSHKDEVNMREFMLWISKGIQEFRKIKSLRKYQPMTSKLHDEFTEYLFKIARKEF